MVRLLWSCVTTDQTEQVGEPGSRAQSPVVRPGGQTSIQGAALPAAAAWSRTWPQVSPDHPLPQYSLFKVIDWGPAIPSPSPISLWHIC